MASISKLTLITLSKVKETKKKFSKYFFVWFLLAGFFGHFSLLPFLSQVHARVVSSSSILTQLATRSAPATGRQSLSGARHNGTVHFGIGRKVSVNDLSNVLRRAHLISIPSKVSSSPGLLDWFWDNGLQWVSFFSPPSESSVPVTLSRENVFSSIHEDINRLKQSSNLSEEQSQYLEEVTKLHANIELMVDDPSRSIFRERIIVSGIVGVADAILYLDENNTDEDNTTLIEGLRVLNTVDLKQKMSEWPVSVRDSLFNVFMSVPKALIVGSKIHILGDQMKSRGAFEVSNGEESYRTTSQLDQLYSSSEGSFAYNEAIVGPMLRTFEQSGDPFLPTQAEAAVKYQESTESTLFAVLLKVLPSVVASSDRQISPEEARKLERVVVSIGRKYRDTFVNYYDGGKKLAEVEAILRYFVPTTSLPTTGDNGNYPSLVDALLGQYQSIASCGI